MLIVKSETVRDSRLLGNTVSYLLWSSGNSLL